MTMTMTMTMNDKKKKNSNAAVMRRSTTTGGHPPPVPVIDMSMERQRLARIIVKSCEEFGIFKVMNHGVPVETVARLERQVTEFFSKPGCEKEQQLQGVYYPPPFGYGCKNIGCNGDMGELEYLILPAADANQSHHTAHFRGAAVNDYVKAVEDLACEVLQLVAEGLHFPDNTVFSNMISDPQSDSILRFNYYPAPAPPSDDHLGLGLGGVRPLITSRSSSPVIGFGEHTDPQILTLLRSNDGAGLQICTRKEKLWVAVPPDPQGFYVMVGDSLQVMSNGKLESVKHRVIMSSDHNTNGTANPNHHPAGRMSTVYFGAPPLHTTISPLPYLLAPNDDNHHLQQQRYRAFTWSEYKTAAYTLRLGDSRLNLFETPTAGHH